MVPHVAVACGLLYSIINIPRDYLFTLAEFCIVLYTLCHMRSSQKSGLKKAAAAQQPD
jgi:hypothetical protein